MLCDSNILIYAADPSDTFCVPFAERDDAAIASVSRIEVLGFPGFTSLSLDSRTRLQTIVGSMLELEMDENVIQRAIVLRQAKKMSLADAVIAATVLAHGNSLATRNLADFADLGLRLINPWEN